MVLFCGCVFEEDTAETTSSEKATTEQAEQTTATEKISFEFEEIYDSGDVGGGYTYYRDTVTDVMYIWRWSTNRGGLTEMSDPETGMPLKYERYKQLASE